MQVLCGAKRLLLLVVLLGFLSVASVADQGFLSPEFAARVEECLRLGFRLRCLFGTDISNALLTDAEIKEIIRLFEASNPLHERVLAL